MHGATHVVNSVDNDSQQRQAPTNQNKTNPFQNCLFSLTPRFSQLGEGHEDRQGMVGKKNVAIGNALRK
jgi:hypothetical protein